MQDEAPEWTLYRSRISYFSGKLEAYLNYKGIPYRRVEVDRNVLRRIHKHTGVMKMPALEAKNGEWLFDTTPTIQWLEKKYGGVSVLPDDPALAFCALLIEDYGDEWLWRPAMWWRWVPLHSRRLLGATVASEIISKRLARPLGWGFARRQLREWLYDDGVNRKNEGKVRDIYYRELEFLEALLASQPFLLGNRPSVADYGYFGSMFRHFNNDPASGEVMRMEAPNTNEWVARVWNAKAGAIGEQPEWVWPAGEFWQPLLDRISNDYLPYLRQNADAYQLGKKRFDFVGKSISFPNTKTTHYRVWCYEMLQQHFRRLSIQDQDRVKKLFRPHSSLDPLTDAPIVDSDMDHLYRLPVPAGEKRGTGFKLRLFVAGQARN